MFRELVTQKLEGRKSEGQANLEGRKIRRYEGKLFTLKSVFSNLPTLISFLNKLDCFGSNEPRNDKASLCNDGVSGAKATLHRNDVIIFSHSEPTGERIQPIENNNLQHSVGNTSLIPTYGLKKRTALTLADGATHVDTSNNIRKAAFTLAEVLITLGIIGVVAALTLPALIANHKYKVLQTQFKKAYSELNEVARMFYNDNEISVPEYVAGGNINKFLSQLPKYLKGISVIDDWNYNDTDENNSYLTTMPYPVHDIKGNNEVKLHCDNYGFRADISGRIYTFNDAPQSGINGPTVCVDINGEKNPNRYGIDIFLFVFTTDGFVIPMGQEHKNNSATTTSGGNSAFVPASEYCRQTTDPVRQYSCAYFALADKNPEGNGDYWNDFLKNKK